MADSKISGLTEETAPAIADWLETEINAGGTSEKVKLSTVQTLMMLAVPAVEWDVDTVASSGATQDLDTSLFGTFDINMSEDCTLSFTNPAPSGDESEFKLILRGAFTPTFPSGVDWSGGAPTYSSPSVYIFSSIDNGGIWFGSSVGVGFI